MLAKLHIKNYALIEESILELGPGLNILTGETGAGKSLLVGAIGLILGKRLDYSRIFNPDKKCVVEATFTQLSAQVLADLSQSEDFDIEDQQVIIRREATSSGKSRAFINDTPVTLDSLREVAQQLVDLHGQHQNQQLLSADQQAALIDDYAGLREDLSKFKASMTQWRQTQKEVEDLRKREVEARQQLEYFQFQLEELESANLDQAEDNQLEERLHFLQNAGEVREELQKATEGLYNGDQSIYGQLAEILSGLRKYAGYDPALQQTIEKLTDFEFMIQESTRELEDIQQRVDLDPEALHELELRNDLLNRLKMKFGAADVVELEQIRDGFSDKVSDFKSIEGQIKAAERELLKLQATLAKQCLELEKKRTVAGKDLSKSINALLTSLGIPNGEFSLDLSRLTDENGSLEIEGERFKPNWRGINKIQFNIRTNKGMPAGPLAQIASGGEISRVMLAIKTALAERTDLSVLIFDEIDSGISGETANKVARVMQQLATQYQLIAITHLPQIAGRGNHHFKISKQIIGAQTVSLVHKLDEEGRIVELAKMLSGDPPSASALENARELIGS